MNHSFATLQHFFHSIILKYWRPTFPLERKKKNLFSDTVWERWSSVESDDKNDSFLHSLRTFNKMFHFLGKLEWIISGCYSKRHSQYKNWKRDGASNATWIANSLIPNNTTSFMEHLRHFLEHLVEYSPKASNGMESNADFLCKKGRKNRHQVTSRSAIDETHFPHWNDEVLN